VLLSSSDSSSVHQSHASSVRTNGFASPPLYGLCEEVPLAHSKTAAADAYLTALSRAGTGEANCSTGGGAGNAEGEESEESDGDETHLDMVRRDKY
jgi:hypothetical protein